MTGESANHTERLAIVGGGTMGRGLATVAAAHGRVLLCTRTPESADKARDGLDPGVEVTCTREDVAECTFVVEAIVEDHDAKTGLLRELDALLGPDAVLATTTSSLSVNALAAGSGRPDRFAGLHVFNPVPKMELVELVYPDGVAERTRARARALCEALGKTAIEVPDTPGFVVNACCSPSSSKVLRRRLARREQLVHARSRSTNGIHAVLMRRLPGKPPVSDLFVVKGLAWLRSRELPSRNQRRCRRRCGTSSSSMPEIAALERLTAQQALACRRASAE